MTDYLVEVAQNVDSECTSAVLSLYCTFESHRELRKNYWCLGCSPKGSDWLLSGAAWASRFLKSPLMIVVCSQGETHRHRENEFTFLGLTFQLLQHLLGLQPHLVSLGSFVLLSLSSLSDNRLWGVQWFFTKGSSRPSIQMPHCAGGESEDHKEAVVCARSYSGWVSNGPGQKSRPPESQSRSWQPGRVSSRGPGLQSRTVAGAGVCPD